MSEYISINIRLIRKFIWVIPVHQPHASCIMHQTWTGDSFHIYYTCFNAILPNYPTLSLSHRVQKTVLYISVSFAVSSFILWFFRFVTLEYLPSLSQKTLIFFISMKIKKKGWNSLFNRNSSMNFTCPLLPIKYSDT